ncbi:tRNA (34-2'-O)-methyltransferase regulator WDR6 [Gastrophryne carolinensis]
MHTMESLLLVAPITALEFVEHHLLAGEGPYLAVCSLTANDISPPRIRQNVLGGYTIHGIRPYATACPGIKDRQLCVFGGKGLTVLRFSIADQEVNLVHVCELQQVHDWIWDVRWLQDSLGLALGHNSVALYDYRNGRVLKEINCAEKCILYSAHFVGNTWEELTLISGTVFNQLVIWGMCDQANDDGRVEPRRRISGHKGVIFSIFYEKCRGFLASASDDRSLRIWKLDDLADSDSDIQCLLVLYGHQSRVWSVKLLQEYIVSIGEDSACIVWSYSGDIVYTFKGHKGRGIRAVAVEVQLGWVATGGADSGIRLWQIKEKPPSSNGLLPLHFGSLERNGAPKAVAMAGTDCLAVMTDLGSIYTYDFASKQWAFVLTDDRYRSYSLLEVLRSSVSTLCAIGSITGSVKIFSLPLNNTCQELDLHVGKVHSLSWVLPTCLAPESCHLFTSGPNGVMVWLEVISSSSYLKSISEMCRFLLPPCKQRWHTSLAFVPKENLIVCGDRRGSLMLFSTKVSGDHKDSVHSTSNCPPSIGEAPDEHMICSVPDSQRLPRDPVCVLYGIHGKLGVTSVTYHDGFVYSTGRDGLYRQLKVEEGQLIVLRKLKSCKGMEWIERLAFMPDGDLQILGFHSTDFVVWSNKTNEKLHSVPCGGGHRSWSYKKEGPTEVFAYIKSGEVFAFQKLPDEKLQKVLKEPLHGRELTCVKYAGTVRTNLEYISILVTSSEDTTVNVLAFNEVSNRIWHLSTISDHLSSVRTLAVAKTKAQSPEKDLSIVLFSAGGRAQIECYRIVVQAKKDGELACNIIHLASHRLDERWERMKNRHRMIKMDPETRYMSVQVLDDAPQCWPPTSFFLAAACSDGSVRFFMMCEDSQKMILVAESFYHQRCVLKVELFVHQSAGSYRVWLCSAATDGRIAFWDITSTIHHAYETLDNELVNGQPQDLGPVCFSLPAHQCGTNSLHIQRTKEGQYLVATGGDDNSIHVCRLEMHSKPEDSSWPGGYHVLNPFTFTSAHAAHVTGLRILQENLLVSSSVDQRLTLWSLTSDGLQHLATRFCHVADVSELDCWRHDDERHWFVLCGQGLEIVMYKHSEQCL